MLISVTFPSKHKSEPKPVNWGFSLLELMVVLVLLGGITSLALPNLTRLYESISLKLERDAIVDELQGLGALALASRQALILPMDSQSSELYLGESGNFTKHSLSLPANWHIELDRDLVVRANGVCLGAEVLMFHRDEEYARLDLKAPYCNASI